MSEVEKMYENAGIEQKYCNKVCEANKYPYQGWCKECKHLSTKYPPFTAEKQIELIKFLMEQDDFSWTIAQQGKNTEYAFYVGYEHSSGDFKEFTKALAGIINDLWQNLTEEEKQQVKEILE